MPRVHEFDELLASICEEWDKAETDIKIAEQISDQVVFPSIKELRYGGRRLVDALNKIAASGSKDEIQALFEDARFNCYRARHDAVDATISTIAAELKISAKTLGYDAVLKAFPKYPDLLGHIRRAQKIISKSRGEREDRDELYHAIEETDFGNIVEMFRDYQVCEPIMRSLAMKERVWKFASVVANVISILVAVVFGYLALK